MEVNEIKKYVVLCSEFLAEIHRQPVDCLIEDFEESSGDVVFLVASYVLQNPSIFLPKGKVYKKFKIKRNEGTIISMMRIQ